MQNEHQPPANLKRGQAWFASIIRRPIDADSNMEPLSPSGRPMEEEARDFILPSPTLQPADRIQIYCQQYWWRFLSNMQELYPFLTRLFGYEAFNSMIAIPYLTKYQPRHWSLHNLGNQLPRWVEEDYHGEDKQLVLDAAAIDCAYNDAFVSAHREFLPGVNDPAAIISTKLTLQPHVHLFHLDGDLFSLRQDFLKCDIEYWQENPFPQVQENGPSYFLLNRNNNNVVVYRSLTPAEYAALNHFNQVESCSFEGLCAWLESVGGDLHDEASTQLSEWIQSWISEGIFTSTPGSGKLRGEKCSRRVQSQRFV